jgi:hypothetical protein
MMSQYTTPNLTIGASNGTTYAYRHYEKAGTVPVVFFQLKLCWASMR